MLLSLLLSSALPAASVPGPELVRIAGDPPALALELRHLPPRPGASATRTVLFVHGATFPSALSFAFPIDGRSWMDEMAAAGFDVWALDFPGFGGSSRPPEMAAPPEAAAPILRAADAARQVARAVAFLQGRSAGNRVCLVAHSWGTMPAALFAAEHPRAVDRLVLYGPLAARTGGYERPPSPWPAHHLMTLEAQWASFSAGVPPGADAPFPRHTLDRSWGPAYLATDADAARRTPPSVKVPFGPMADAAEAARGLLPYDPGRIRVPTLLVRGSWDAVTTDADLQGLFAALSSSPLKRAVTIGGGTHRMHLERVRQQLYREVHLFLDGRDE